MVVQICIFKFASAGVNIHWESQVAVAFDRPSGQAGHRVIMRT